MSLRPGMHRGGRSNPQHAVYEQGDHTLAQFRDLLGDPNMVVILGGERMTLDHVAAIEADAASKAEAAAAATDPAAVEARKAEIEAEVAKAEAKTAAMQAAKIKKA